MTNCVGEKGFRLRGNVWTELRDDSLELSLANFRLKRLVGRHLLRLRICKVHELAPLLVDSVACAAERGDFLRGLRVAFPLYGLIGKCDGRIRIGVERAVKEGEGLFYVFAGGVVCPSSGVSL